MEFKVFVESKFGKRIKILQNDNGNEFFSKQFKDLMWNMESNIKHQTSTPYTPQQNGVFEHFNRTIVESAHSMIHQRGINVKYWAEAINTIVYLKARSPHKAISSMTLKESWSKKKPKVSHLNFFGNTCYALKPSQTKTKLERKSTKYMFVGCSANSKAY